jgi:hypothetical protein
MDWGVATRTESAGTVDTVERPSTGKPAIRTKIQAEKTKPGVAKGETGWMALRL